MINFLRRLPFRIERYWDSRYKDGGNSGSGSYGELATFKAEILNSFIKEKNVKNIIDLGCGDGNVLSLLQGYKSYLGVDVSEYIIKQCNRKFVTDRNKKFKIYEADLFRTHKADLVLSLDVIFHLVKNKDYFEYLENLFKLSTQYVIIYSSNQIGEDVNHVKERVFIKDVLDKYPNWKLIKTVNNRFPYNPKLPDITSRSNFYVFSKT